MSVNFARRHFILGAALSLAGARIASATALPRIAAIDWAMLETALALGMTPVAATELKQFRQVAIEPPVPEAVADLGLRGVPNYELLRITAPELILSSPFYERQRGRLEQIAPVLSVPVYLPGQAPYALAEQATLTLGEKLGRNAEAAALVARTRDLIAVHRTELQRIKHPLFIVSFGDSRHVRVFGADGMFGDVLARLGLGNAWTARTSYSATAPVGLEALALMPDAAVVVLGPTPPDVQRSLARNALWNALPAVKRGRVLTLDPVNHFGALPAAARFARLLSLAATSAGEAFLG